MLSQGRGFGGQAALLRPGSSVACLAPTLTSSTQVSLGTWGAGLQPLPAMSQPSEVSQISPPEAFCTSFLPLL